MRFLFILVTAMLLPSVTFAACATATNGRVMKVVWDASGSATVTSESTATMTATDEGAVVYDSTYHKLKMCDGTNWIPVLSGNSSGAVLTSLMTVNTSAPVACTAGNRGQMALNNVNNLLVAPSMCVCAIGGWKKMDGLGTPCVWYFP